MIKVNCNFCDSNDYAILFSGFITKYGEIELVKCNNCGLVYCNPQLTKDELKSYYAEDYYGVNNLRFIGIIEKFVRLKRRIRAARVHKYVNGGKVLDIGCGRGIFLNEMRKKGYDVYGTEFSETGANFAREVLKLDISIGELVTLKFPDNNFDIITIYHVLEHLSNPVQTLHEAKRILKPGGLLLIAVPNIDSWQAKIFKTYWFHLDIPRHYYHFSPVTLSNMLPGNSWDLLKVKKFSFEQGPFGWVQSTANLIFHNRDNILYNILKENASGTLIDYVTKQFKLFRWTITLLNLFIGLILLIPATIVSWLVAFSDHNEIMELYYRKK
jgi:2-polyprenyl-3-methyl-5-hydroxy-6-metoxy-1,4-benzoquinol methylase